MHMFASYGTNMQRGSCLGQCAMLWMQLMLSSLHCILQVNESMARMNLKKQPATVRCYANAHWTP